MAAVSSPPAPAALFDLGAKLGAPAALSQLGISQERARAAAPRVLAEAGGEFRPLRSSDIADLRKSAHAGRRAS